MQNIKNISDKDFIGFICEKLISDKKIFISLIGWDDFDYFIELCDEDGGASQDHINKYKNLSLYKRIKNLNLLIKEIKEFQNYPVLQSYKGNIKFFYDMHIWSNSYYIVYNSFLKKMIVKKSTIIDKLLSPTITPAWQNYQ